MCGIVGYVGDDNATPILLHGLQKLEYRGYDSAGIAVRNHKDDTVVVKAEGKIINLINKIENMNILGSAGVGHSRWSTHGAATENNAHPHYSDDYNIIGVHNGIIENYQELKAKLLRHGYSFYSETDTEVMIKLIDYYCKKYKGGPIDAINKAMVRARGSYALAIMCKNYPDQVWFAKKGSPLVVAKSDNGCYLASDVPAILKFSNHVYYVDDLECGCITKDDVKFYDLNGDDITSKKELKTIEWKASAADKGTFATYMAKEMAEQPVVIKYTIDEYVNIKDYKINFEKCGITNEYLKSLDAVYIYACGSAYHAGMIGQYLIENLTGINARVELASEFKYRNYRLRENALCVFISQSGETKDTHEALLKCKQLGIRTLAVCNVKDSTIARSADYNIYTYAGPEIAVATTKAYSCQLIIMYLLAIKISFAKQVFDYETLKGYLNEIETIPSKVQSIIDNSDKIQHLSTRFVGKHDVFFIGRGIDYCLCMEGSLKFKEITYIHSEAYAAGELKHGPISLIQEGVAVVAVATQPDLIEKSISNMTEVKSRAGSVVAVTTEDNEMEKNSKYQIYVPSISHLFTPSLTIIPLQLLAYYTSLGKGIDPDKPKNLAKSVTVE